MARSLRKEWRLCHSEKEDNVTVQPFQKMVLTAKTQRAQSLNIFLFSVEMDGKQTSLE